MEENKKLTYEQLQNVAANLSTQVQQLNRQLQEANMYNAFKRLDYLFKVVDSNGPFDSDFILTCVDEIKKIMTIEENKEETTEDTKEV